MKKSKREIEQEIVLKGSLYLQEEYKERFYKNGLKIGYNGGALVTFPISNYSVKVAADGFGTILGRSGKLRDNDVRKLKSKLFDLHLVPGTYRAILFVPKHTGIKNIIMTDYKYLLNKKTEIIEL